MGPEQLYKWSRNFRTGFPAYIPETFASLSALSILLEHENGHENGQQILILKG